MRLAGELVDGRFVLRLNRFAATVDVGGRQVLVHVPNSGRMRELLTEGADVLLGVRPGRRKTGYDLLMVRHEARWVGVDARLPARLLEEALASGLGGLGPFHTLRREVRFGKSRLDLMGIGRGGAWLIEAKSVNLVRDGVALFPDAPTARGSRHVEELRRAAEGGLGAAVVFVVQRSDAFCLRPLEEADPLFAATLRTAAPVVKVLAYRCDVGRGEIRISGSIPVEV